MRLLLHIGMAKTGTSTLQSTLTANRRKLLRAGVLYPEPTFGRTNHNLVTALLHPFDEMPREFTSGGASYDTVRATGDAFWQHVVDEVRRSKADVAVLSGEYFYGLSEPKVALLAAMVQELFDDIHVVCYVRHPASYYVSFMQQRVRASSVIRPPGQFQLRAKPCLSRYLDAFDGNVSVRSGDRSSLVDGCIVRDFLTSFVPGGPELAGQIPVTDVNESMSGEAMCILQRLRRHAWPGENNRFAAESNHVVDLLNRMRDRAPQSPARLRPPIEAAVVEHHQRDFAFLAERFGVTFPADAASAASSTGTGVDPDGWLAEDLTEILDVDPEHVERTLYLLLRQLAAEATATRRRRA